MEVFRALPPAFFDQPPPMVARALLGARLVRRVGDAVLAGRIVETEAYLSAGDAAAHGARPMTQRTRVLFGPAGRAYVYRLRQYALLDVTTEGPGVPGAVLLRAVEPVLGAEHMLALGGGADVRRVASGPGKLCRAFAVDLTLNGADLTDADGPLFLAAGPPEAFEVRVTPRVGITRAQAAPLRFVVAGSASISRP
ncbi:DNA-3-methyladenine glycosylase [Deinococcus maricopensis]|uniref:Putative 3-methyladenine DNA glycosylase n=1 Tax=Deinococcus maricopensis (strain DSM 21211 / LMG 22137 / NRRL B-23946 / LB-34) TaxID=709986 RepID=E8U4Z8_DEIML|nr:DNA-3-methyladenine glycosylase [Deinococcus maricopensis]ADV66137.1 3-methyladenine DNA glycosylase [Deinococcus maricopensis DSM 21211]